jgi:hypothetical protein
MLGSNMGKMVSLRIPSLYINLYQLEFFVDSTAINVAFSEDLRQNNIAMEVDHQDQSFRLS